MGKKETEEQLATSDAVKLEIAQIHAAVVSSRYDSSVGKWKTLNKNKE